MPVVWLAKQGKEDDSVNMLMNIILQTRGAKQVDFCVSGEVYVSAAKWNYQRISETNACCIS